MTTLTTTAAEELTQNEAIGQLANHYAAQASFEDYTSRKSANTLRAQQTDLATFADYLADIEIEKDASQLQTEPDAWQGMTWGLVAGFVKWMLADGFATGTVNRKLSTVRTYAKLAVQAGTLSSDEYNQMRLVSGYGSKEAKRIDEQRAQTRKSDKKAEHVSLPSLQVAQLKAQPLDTAQGARDAVLVCLLLDHGLRVGELARVDVGNLDMDAGTLSFYRPKVDKMQTLRFTEDTATAMRAYAPHMPDAGGLLLGSRKGGILTYEPMSERAITKRVRYLGKCIDIEGLSAHDLRHGWATRAAKGGTDAFALRDAGGWSSLAMPSRYVEDSAISNERVKLA